MSKRLFDSVRGPDSSPLIPAINWPPKQIQRAFLFSVLWAVPGWAQPADTGAAHKAAAEALMDDNNRGAGRLACPANIGAQPTAAPIVPNAAGRGAAKGKGKGKGGGRGPGGVPPRENWYAEGGKIFDNVYLLTTQTNSAFAVTTSEGIILIDSLFEYAAQDAIVDGLKKEGLDPDDIKYVVISHAHGDHDGAVNFLQDNYDLQVIMGPKDWELAERRTDPPRHDIVAEDGMRLTLGDTTVTIYITPGHTEGTLSVLVPVKDDGEDHLAMEWGGTALNGNTSQEMLQSYISNARRIKDIAGGRGADVIIGNHTEYNDALNRLARTQERAPGELNPWIVGKDEVEKYLTVVEECAKSWLAISNGRP